MTMGYKDKIATMRGEIRVMNKLIPDAAAGFGQLSKAVKESGPLTVAQKEWVALGMAIAQRCEPCINFHVEAHGDPDGRRTGPDVCRPCAGLLGRTRRTRHGGGISAGVASGA